MADSRFEKSLDVSESSEESEAAEATNDETLAEYPQEVTSFAFVNQSKSNEARNFSLLSFLRHLGFFWFSQWIFSKPCYFAHALFLCRESDPDPLGHVRRMYDVRMTSPQAAGYSLIHPNDVSRRFRTGSDSYSNHIKNSIGHSTLDNLGRKSMIRTFLNCTFGALPANRATKVDVESVSWVLEYIYIPTSYQGGAGEKSLGTRLYIYLVVMAVKCIGYIKNNIGIYTWWFRGTKYQR